MWKYVPSCRLRLCRLVHVMDHNVLHKIFKDLIIFSIYRKWCTCGSENPLNIYTKQDESVCNRPCPGSSTQKCGAILHYSVYETGIERKCLIIMSLKISLNQHCFQNIHLIQVVMKLS